MAAMLFAAGLFLLLAIVVASFLVIAFFWSTEYRYWAIGLLSLAYAATGLMLIWSVCRRVKAEPAPFAATLEELHRDLVVLGQLRESFVEGVRDQGTSAETSTEVSAGTSTEAPAGTHPDHQRRGHHE
jgi:membrane protein implicated in regulation of membrane protease activity